MVLYQSQNFTQLFDHVTSPYLLSEKSPKKHQFSIWINFRTIWNDCWWNRTDFPINIIGREMKIARLWARKIQKVTWYYTSPNISHNFLITWPNATLLKISKKSSIYYLNQCLINVKRLLMKSTWFSNQYYRPGNENGKAAS